MSRTSGNSVRGACVRQGGLFSDVMQLHVPRDKATVDSTSTKSSQRLEKHRRNV